MSLIQKVRNAISAHPRITTTAAVFGIGLAITVVIGTVAGVLIGPLTHTQKVLLTLL